MPSYGTDFYLCFYLSLSVYILILFTLIPFYTYNVSLSVFFVKSILYCCLYVFPLLSVSLHYFLILFTLIHFIHIISPFLFSFVLSICTDVCEHPLRGQTTEKSTFLKLTPRSRTYELRGQGKKKAYTKSKTNTSHCPTKTNSKSVACPFNPCSGSFMFQKMAMMG